MRHSHFNLSTAQILASFVTNYLEKELKYFPDEKETFPTEVRQFEITNAFECNVSPLIFRKSVKANLPRRFVSIKYQLFYVRNLLVQNGDKVFFKIAIQCMSTGKVLLCKLSE